VVEVYPHTKLHGNRKNFLWTYGRTDTTSNSRSIRPSPRRWPNNEYITGTYFSHKTSGQQSNLTKKAHRYCTWMVQLYMPSCANVTLCASLDPRETKSQTSSRSVQLFLHNSHQGVHISLQRAAPFPPQNRSLHAGSETPSNAWCLGPTRVHNRNGTTNASAIFAGLTIMADRPRYSLSVTITTSKYAVLR